MSSGKGDEMKGRIKEGAGDVLDDDKLKREGKLDKASGKTKQAVDDVKDRVGDAIDDVTDRD